MGAGWTLTGQLPIESSSLDIAIFILRTPDLLGAQWLEEIARVLKPGGTILTQTFLPPNDTDKVIHFFMS